MYYLLIIQNYSIPQVFTFNTKSEALATYHNELAYRHESRTSTVCILYDRKGNVQQSEYYDAVEFAEE